MRIMAPANIFVVPKALTGLGELPHHSRIAGRQT